MREEQLNLFEKARPERAPLPWRTSDDEDALNGLFFKERMRRVAVYESGAEQSEKQRLWAAVSFIITSMAGYGIYEGAQYVYSFVRAWLWNGM
jgi:hypothetical protein